MTKSLAKSSSLEKYSQQTLSELADILDALTTKQQNQPPKSPEHKATSKEMSVVRLAIQQRQRLIKATAMQFEQTNTHHLLFFASTGGFVKIAGHSALFFASTIASRIHWRYSLKLDTDRYSVSEDGIISFRSIERIQMRLAEINIFLDDGLSDEEYFYFTLPKVYNDEQIDRLRDQAQDDLKQILNIVLPSSPIPMLYDAIMQTSQMLYYQFKHISDNLAKETIGHRVILMTCELSEDYFAYAHAKSKDSMKHLENIIKTARKLRHDVAYASKLQILHHREVRKVLEQLVAVERIASRAYMRKEKTDGKS